MRRSAVPALAFLLLFGLSAATAAHAHPPSILNQAAEQAVGEEITAFRKAIADAVRAKDAVKLKEMYHPGFTHTHTSGKTDNRDARIVSAVTGEPLIETSETLELQIRVPNDWVAVATGTSPIKSRTDGKTYAVKWIQVFTRTEKSWVLVASQATRSHEIKP
jgi:ketosteroid isomerase-like protein